MLIVISYKWQKLLDFRNIDLTESDEYLIKLNKTEKGINFK